MRESVPPIADSRFLIIPTHGFDQSKLIEPRERLEGDKVKIGDCNAVVLPPDEPQCLAYQ